MGRRLAAARTANRWTQKDLAERTGWTQKADDEGQAKGLSPSRIANYEQGERRIGIEEADIFSSVFDGLPAAYFLCVVDEREARVLNAMRHEAPNVTALRRP